MLDDIVLSALAVAIGVAIVAAPLGCFVVWRRMAYFGATVSHAALLGIALALLLSLAPMIGVLIVGLALVPLLIVMQRLSDLSNDTLLGLLAHAMLATGIVLLALMPWVRVDLMGYLFGDVLAVTPFDITVIYLAGASVLALLWWLWRPLLAGTVSEELAAAEGLNPERASIYFMIMIAIMIAIAMKVVGILLIVSLLIIPPAAARTLARNPEQMVVIAALLGIASVVAGLSGAIVLDTPAGPSIVVAASLIFLICTISVNIAGPVRRFRRSQDNER